ncbi:MAG: cadherin repeat domain-containing protein, partial [Colwellia sp.]
MLPKFKKNLLPLSLAISATLLTACNSDDANNAPELTGDLMSVVAENTLLVGQYTATDVDNNNITLTLNEAANELFTLDQSGLLSFKVAPDFENGDIGPFNVTIVATDDGKGAMSTE